jgi:hypothetical protein
MRSVSIVSVLTLASSLAASCIQPSEEERTAPSDDVVDTVAAPEPSHTDRSDDLSPGVQR